MDHVSNSIIEHNKRTDSLENYHVPTHGDGCEALDGFRSGEQKTERCGGSRWARNADSAISQLVARGMRYPQERRGGEEGEMGISGQGKD